MVAGLTTTSLAAFNATAAGTLALDDFFTRLEAVALVQTLNAEILASRSATLTLERWGDEHGLAGISKAKVVARLVGIEPKTVTEDQRRRLGIGPEEAVKYRHVQLFCGDQILSEADNWYVPSRLTAEMNRLLETTATAEAAYTLLDTLTRLPPGARCALDAIRRTETPLQCSALVPA
jgi:hypothetical protein